MQRKNNNDPPECDHWDDNCLCGVGWIGSLALAGIIMWRDFKKPRNIPTPPPPPPPLDNSNNH